MTKIFRSAIVRWVSGILSWAAGERCPQSFFPLSIALVYSEQKGVKIKSLVFSIVFTLKVENDLNMFILEVEP